jgi:hypothetical protein
MTQTIHDEVQGYLQEIEENMGQRLRTVLRLQGEYVSLCETLSTVNESLLSPEHRLILEYRATNLAERVEAFAKYNAKRQNQEAELLGKIREFVMDLSNDESEPKKEIKTMERWVA